MDREALEDLLQKKVGQIEEMKEKYQHLKEIMLDMRKNYVKEIQLMREISYVKPVEETTKKSKIRRSSYNEFENKLEVFIFNPTEGLEPELCKTFNDYT